MRFQGATRIVTLRCSVCLSVGLAVCLSVCLAVCPSVCLLVWLFVCLSVWLFLCLYICLFLCLFVCLFVWLFVCLSVCFSVSLSVCFSVCLSVCLFICLFVYLSVCLSFCLSLNFPFPPKNGGFFCILPQLYIYIFYVPCTSTSNCWNNERQMKKKTFWAAKRPSPSSHFAKKEKKNIKTHAPYLSMRDLFTSLPLKKARSSIGADRDSDLTRPMLYPPSMDATPPPSAGHQPSKDQSQSPHGNVPPSPWNVPPPMEMCNPPMEMCNPPPWKCGTPYESATSRVAWYSQQQSTLASGAKSLVCGWEQATSFDMSFHNWVALCFWSFVRIVPGASAGWSELNGNHCILVRFHPFQAGSTLTWPCHAWVWPRHEPVTRFKEQMWKARCWSGQLKSKVRVRITQNA